MTELVEAVYAYSSASTLEPSRTHGSTLALATSGGVAGEARLFAGTARRADLVADGLLVVGAVARSRFHVPAAMLARVILAADPIVTVADDQLRFESLSACAGVYARLDLLSGSVDGTTSGRGTTNVDFGSELRAALASVDDRQLLGLTIGSDSVTVRSGQAEVRERRVPLPARWIRSLTEVAAIGPTLEVVGVLERGAAIRLLREALGMPVNRPAWLVIRAGTGRLAHHAVMGSMAAAGLGRLRPLERMLRHLRRLTVYAAPDGTSAWQADADGVRLTLVLSPQAWRGLSAEGRALSSLVTPPTDSTASLRAALRWHSVIDRDQIAAMTRNDRETVDAGLALLATAGIVGYDLAERAYFHRELPFGLDRLAQRQPRLAAARRIVERGGVRIEGEAGEDTVAWVTGTGADHRVTLGEDGSTCTCPWFARYRGERGPCKHVLAAQLALLSSDDA